MWHISETREVPTGFCWGDLRERDHLEDLVHRWEHNIKTDCQEVGWRGMGWINVAQDRDRYQALVNVVRKLHVP